jgi:hypothetical protein
LQPIDKVPIITNDVIINNFEFFIVLNLHYELNFITIQRCDNETHQVLHNKYKILYN